MLRSVGLMVVVFATGLALAGCGGPLQWEVTAENQSDGPCSFFVTLGSDGNGHANVESESHANVENVGQGETLALISGNTNTVVKSVKVMRGDEEQSLTPNTELPIGKRFAIVVRPDGRVETSVSDR